MVLEDRFVFVAQNVAGLEESGQVSVSGSTARDGTLGKVLFKKLCRYFAGLPRAIVFRFGGGVIHGTGNGCGAGSIGKRMKHAPREARTPDLEVNSLTL